MTLKEYRKSKGYTQAQIAKILGVTASQYQMWEAGTRTPNLDTLFLFADKLQVQIKIRPHEDGFNLQEEVLMEIDGAHPQEVIDAALEFYARVQNLSTKKAH